jgi:hypothetical protein
MVAGTFLFVSIVEIGLKEILLCRDSHWMGDKLSRREMEWTKLAAFLVVYKQTQDLEKKMMVGAWKTTRTPTWIDHQINQSINQSTNKLPSPCNAPEN